MKRPQHTACFMDALNDKHTATNIAIFIVLTLIGVHLFSSIPDHYRPEWLQKNRPLNPEQLDQVHKLFDIYVINLDRDPERLQRFQERMTKNNLAFTRIAGVDGTRLNRSELVASQTITAAFNDIATPGEIGCVLSHKAVWTTAKSSQKPYIVVLEDDLMVKENLARQLWELSQYINKYQFDLLLLGRDTSTNLACRLQLLKPHMCVYHDNNVYPQFEPGPQNWHRIIQPPYSGSTFAYLIPKAKLDRMLHAYRFPLKSIADREYWNPEHQLRIKAVEPAWYLWESHESAYGDSRTLYHDPKKPLRSDKTTQYTESTISKTAT